MLRNKTLALVFGGALLAAPMFAQEEAPFYRNEASVQAFGSFTKSTTENGIQQNATNTGGVLGSYRWFFNQHNGVELNYGYSLNTLNFNQSTGNTGVNTYSHEATAAYVFRFPMHRFTPFAEAGVGALIFDPKNFAGASAQAKPAFVYGAGADFNISKRLFLRAGYRALVYNSPNFDISGLSNDRLTHRAEPFGGIGFRF
jgi:outer membrane immunogenic protein